MAFSPTQQRMYRIMVQSAWTRHCSRNAMPVKDLVAKDTWIRDELEQAVGKRSTTACNKTRDFETAMAHFEAICGDDIHWQWQLFRGDAKRVIHNLNELATGHDIDEDYLRRIARNALKRDHLPDLHELPPEDLLTILRAVKIHVRRRLLRDDETLTPGPAASEEIHWSYAATAAAQAPADYELPEVAEEPF
jgi:hypothetical protein